MTPPSRTAQRIGVFGGTFDPIHSGHLLAASCAYDQLHLDRVLFVPAGDPWQKAGQHITAASHRSAMVAAAIAPDPRFALSTIELEHAGPSYSVETLAKLHARDPEAELVLLIGADAYANRGTWHRAAELDQFAQLAVVSRAGEPEPRLQPGHVLVGMPGVHISSTQCRVRVAHGQAIEYMVPLEVARYIAATQLYRDGGRL